MSTEQITPADYFPVKAYIKENPNQPWCSYDSFHWNWKRRTVNGMNATKVVVKAGGTLYVVPKRIPAWMDWQSENEQKLSA